MADIQLIVNGEQLDLKGGEKIPVTFQTQSIENITEKKGNFSRSFNIPRTDNNQRILEYAFTFTIESTLPYKRIPAVLKLNGQEMPIGFIIIEDDGISETEIKITYYSGNSNFFQFVNELKLKDCNFGDASHLWNDDTILNSGANPYYVYPFIDYTDDELNFYFSNEGAERKIVGRHMLPALYANTYKKAIEYTTGYKLQGELFNLPIWNNLIFPFSLNKFKRRKEQAADRINIDMASFIYDHYARNVRHRIPLLDSNRQYTKFGNDNFCPYVGTNLSYVPTASSVDDTTGQIYFPDYTRSKFEFRCRITTDVTSNIRFFITTELEMNGGYFFFNYSSTILFNTIQGKMTHSKNGTILPMTITPQGEIKYTGVPQSYFTNPNLSYDWIIDIEFEFITGLQCSVGLSFEATWDYYFYETSTKIRMLNHIEHSDLSNYTHGVTRNWNAGVIYEGQNKVYVLQGNNVNANLYKLIVENSQLTSPSNANYWEDLGSVGGSIPAVVSNLWKYYTEETEEDYYTIKYGGQLSECGLTRNAYHPQYSWVTGSDMVPDINVATWIKNIANLFGCMINVNEDDKVVEFKMWNEIFNDKAKAYDWSKNVVNLKNGKWTTRNKYIAQNNFFQYADDNRLPINFAAYNLQVNDETLPVEKTLYKLYFGATDTKPKFRNTINAPFIPLFDDVGKLSGNNLQRILILDKIYFDVLSVTDPIKYVKRDNAKVNWKFNVPFCYFNDNTKPYQLGFDTYMYQQFHRFLGYIYDKYRELNCEIIITSSEIKNIDLLKPVYIEYYQNYFFILKINDWNSGEICKVDLLKLD